MNLLGVLRNFNVEQFGWQSVDHPLAPKGLLHPTKRAEAVLADDESVSYIYIFKIIEVLPHPHSLARGCGEDHARAKSGVPPVGFAAR